MLDVGVLVETLETATFWSGRDRVYAAVRDALTGRSPGDKRAGALPHLARLRDRRARCTSPSRRRRRDDPLAQWQRGQGRGQRRDDRRRRHHHPPPRRRHRPQALAGPRDRAGRASAILRAVKAELDPTGHPQPGGADPVSSPRDEAPLRRAGRPGVTRSFSFLVNPLSGGGAAPGAVVPVARLLREAGATVEVTYSPGTAGHPRPGPVRRGPRRRGGRGRRRRDAVVGRRRGGRARRDARHRAGRPRQRLRPDARPPDDPADVARVLLSGTPVRGRPGRARPAGRQHPGGGRLGVRRRRRAGRRAGGPGALAAAQAAVPLRRGARAARPSPPRRTPSSSTAPRTRCAPRPSWSRTPAATAPA